jgi:RNA polymerase sigma-70 factor (family 1)
MHMLTANNGCKAFFDAIATGDEASFERFFVSYRVRVYALAYKWTKSAYYAEEITQDVFISIWNGRGNLAAVKDPDTYFYTIIYNKINRHFKKEANRERILRLSVQDDVSSSNETEETIYINEGQRFIHKAITQLSPQKQLIYQLSRHEGKNYDEIAEALQLSRHTVKSHLFKAVKFVKDYMKENF